MSNYNELELYLVTEGDVTEALPDTESDGQNSILVASTSAENALRVAQAYDKKITDFENLAWHGKSICVVTLIDKETGLYI